MRKRHFRSIIVIMGSVFVSGCVGYVAPYPEYSAPIVSPYVVPPPAFPYRSYRYEIYPVVPVPRLRFGGPVWGRGWHGHYRHH